MDYWSVATAPTNDKQEMTEVGAINGGLGKREGPLAHPTFTLDVPDIERALSVVEKNGGKTVQPKMPVGEMGFTAYFKDTEGNVVGLFQSPSR